MRECKEIKIINEKTGETFTTKVDATSELLVQEKDKVSRGDKLIVGSIDPKELLKVKDVVTVEKYILDEVLKVYKSQNVDISDKHIEIIIRQMLRKIAVLNEGDTNLIPGRNVSVNTFIKAIDEAIAENGELPVGKQLILGITKAALGSDSFLAAASFQETTRVLTQAAIEGKYDTLQGLKENTLIGGLIPAGTGILEEESFECKHRPEDEMLDDDNNNSEGSNAFELYSEPTDETSDTPTGDYEETSIDEL
jgi:DNA-directed RNA polymerase subunit beta'